MEDSSTNEVRDALACPQRPSQYQAFTREQARHYFPLLQHEFLVPKHIPQYSASWPEVDNAFHGLGVDMASG